MTNSMPFAAAFKSLTGNAPFPWQEALFERFILTDPAKRFPDTCDIPTGLGKTLVIAVWLLALAHHARNGSERTFPRRLVYVVNRRTVVDQSTREATQLRKKLREDTDLKEIADALCGLASSPDGAAAPLAISTLRGQFADNAEWRDDPACPAVVVGTVDMIGSRLLFNGYGRGFKTRPLHAAFLGQDALLVHDEAHLEPAFQVLVEAICKEQQRGSWEKGRFHVMALSATARSDSGAFSLTARDFEDETVIRRIQAKKGICFHPIDDGKKTAEAVSALALQSDFRDSGQAILVFLQQVKDVETVTDALRKAGQQVATLTGTLRGYERDALARDDGVFARFVPKSECETSKGTVYLVCTSAGEVGVNISSDHLVCDLTPFDSMAQRLGRVNRFGDGEARVEVVVAPRKLGDALMDPCLKTRDLLGRLPMRNDLTSDGQPRHDASPLALRELPAKERQDAFSPSPAVLPVTDILFDAWSMTTIRAPMPGRPPVDEYLHGVTEPELAETYVAWRQEVEEIASGELLAKYPPDELLEDFPLKPHEVLRDRSYRVIEQLDLIAVRCPDATAWLVDANGTAVPRLLSNLVLKDKKTAVELDGATVILPPHVGGLSAGLLQGTAEFNPSEKYDVADLWNDEFKRKRRERNETPVAPAGMRLIRRIDLVASSDDSEPDGDEPKGERSWYWYVQPRSADDDGSWTSRSKELLVDHLRKAGTHAAAIASRLVSPEEAHAVICAAKWHDLGKQRMVWQRSIGNTKSEVLAKSGPEMRPVQVTSYRHEFGSLIDIDANAEFTALSLEQRNLIKHLIAAHHGRARPHFPKGEAFDPERTEHEALLIACEVPRRFASLQRRYGRWGLAYLESLVRAADALASQDIGEIASPAEAAE